jgi:hypothetical protein
MYVLTLSLTRATCLANLIVTKSMEQSISLESKSHSVTLHLVWNPNVLHRIHKSPPPIPILNQNNPVHVVTHYFLQVHFNIILPVTRRAFKWFLSFGSPAKILYAFLIFPTHAPSIPLSLILTPQQCVMKSKHYETSQYANFSSHLPHPPS